MPLNILLILVVAGIAGIAALTWVLGHGRRAEIADEDHLRALWDADNPADPARDAILCRSRHAGLIETAAGHGIVWAFGADFVTRPLDGARLHDTGRRLVLHLPDYTAPKIALDLTEEETALWVENMERTNIWART